MSGSEVAYHLRPNKYVERQLTFDAIDFVRVWNGPSAYCYVSMGGRFLEDFRWVNERLPVVKMISIEGDEITHRRQQFNRPLAHIECLRQDTADFLVDFDVHLSAVPNARWVVWLDYTTPKQREVQLREFHTLVSKLKPGDVAKITMNANPTTLADKTKFKRIEEYRQAVYDALAAQLGEFMPVALTEADMTVAGFATTLAKAVKKAAHSAVDGKPFGVRPLTICRYNDSQHQMLTVTAIVTDKATVAKMETDPIFMEWNSRPQSWEDVHLIDVPDLSFKERAFIHEHWPTDNDDAVAHSSLPFRLADTDSRSLARFSQYRKYYRRYPSFARVWM